MSVLSEHLTEAQIESYVSRRAGVDEILSTAQHLDDCFRCRDRAAAMVDSGVDEISHTRKRPELRTPDSRRVNLRRLLPWIIAAVVVAVVIVVVLNL